LDGLRRRWRGRRLTIVHGLDSAVSGAHQRRHHVLLLEADEGPGVPPRDRRRARAVPRTGHRRRKEVQVRGANHPRHRSHRTDAGVREQLKFQIALFKTTEALIKIDDYKHIKLTK